MRLDINNSGAWKNLVEFPDNNLAVVRAAVSSLVKASDGGRAKYKISDEDGARFYLEAPSPEWKPAK